MARQIAVLCMMLLLFPTTELIEAGQRKSRVDVFLEKLEKKGFVVQEGRIDLPDIAGMCCRCELPTCYGNNPSSPYGVIALPPAPGQLESIKNPYSEWFYEDGYYPEGWSWFFRQRADEAIVFIGKTPPRMDYFGLTGYVYDRYSESVKLPPACIPDNGELREQPESARNRLPMFASIGDTINNMVVNVAGPARNPFDSNVVFIIAADRKIERKIRKSLLKAGYSDKTINTMVVSPSLVRFGVESESDSLMYLFRYASDITPELEQYLASSIRLFRVSPARPVPLSDIEPLKLPKLRKRGTGKTEVDLLPVVDALGEAIKAEYPDHEAMNIVTANWYEGFNCIANSQNCLGDNRDTPYILPATNPLTRQPLQDLTLAADEFYVAYGVNHQKTGKATYSNVSVLGWKRKFSPAVFSSDHMPGSAGFYLGSGADRATSDKLYAWKIARPGGCDTDDTPHCLEVGYDCQDGIAEDDSIGLVFRAYMEPKTTVGAAYGEIVIDRIVKFKPKQLR